MAMVSAGRDVIPLGGNGGPGSDSVSVHLHFRTRVQSRDGCIVDNRNEKRMIRWVDGVTGGRENR